MEPYQLQEETRPLTQGEMTEYISYIRGIVDETIDGLDLDRQETGYHWYPNMTKLSHQIMNLRHLQGHVGQLSELLMANGIDTDWVSLGKSPQP